MPQCEQLHRDLQISWSVFGDQVTFEIAVRMGKFMLVYVKMDMMDLQFSLEWVSGLQSTLEY